MSVLHGACWCHVILHASQHASIYKPAIRDQTAGCCALISADCLDCPAPPVKGVVMMQTCRLHERCVHDGDLQTAEPLSPAQCWHTCQLQHDHQQQQ